MSIICRSALAATFVLAALPAEARTYVATDSNLKSVFAEVRSGDTIRLSGRFGKGQLRNRRFDKTLTIDARGATFDNTLALSNVSGITVLGGKFGNANKAIGTAVRVSNADRITFASPVVVGDFGRQIGISVSKSSNIAVDNGSFTGMRLGVGFTSVRGGTITNSRSMRATSDGFAVADSHNVLVSRNSCSGTAITPGSHPDCVQLWSIAGRPRQSDIEISDNIATGATQGFTSFNASAGGGLRIKMLRNRVDTSYPQGIACYNCEASVFEGNVLTTQAGARHRTSINIVGGRNNIVSNNRIGARPRSRTSNAGALAEMAFADSINVGDSLAQASFTDLGDGVYGFANDGFDGAVAFDDFADFEFTDDGFVSDDAERMMFATDGVSFDEAVGGIPEPGTWALLLLGFGAVGTVARRRRVAAA